MIIGRIQEQETFQKLLQSNQAEFGVVYGPDFVGVSLD